MLLVSASRRNNLFFAFHQPVKMSELKQKFAIAGRARQHAVRVRYPDYANTRGANYSPMDRRNLARAYSRFSFAMKLALISAGQTASHS
jgi:hypothetical protein